MNIAVKIENPVDDALRKCQRIFERGTKATTDVEWDAAYESLLAAIDSRNVPQPAPDAGGEWRQSGYDPSQIVAVSDGRVVATCGNADIAAQILRDRAAAETYEDETDKEIRRWQDAIRDKLIDLGAPDWKIDGAGCDSGDPLDFTLAEVGQGAGYFVDQLDEQRTLAASVPKLVEALREAQGALINLKTAATINLQQPNPPNMAKSIDYWPWLDGWFVRCFGALEAARAKPDAALAATQLQEKR